MWNNVHPVNRLFDHTETRFASCYLSRIKCYAICSSECSLSSNWDHCNAPCVEYVYLPPNNLCKILRLMLILNNLKIVYNSALRYICHWKQIYLYFASHHCILFKLFWPLSKIHHCVRTILTQAMLVVTWWN